MIYLPGSFNWFTPCIHVMQGVFLMVIVIDPFLLASITYLKEAT